MVEAEISMLVMMMMMMIRALVAAIKFRAFFCCCLDTFYHGLVVSCILTPFW